MMTKKMPLKHISRLPSWIFTIKFFKQPVHTRDLCCITVLQLLEMVILLQRYCDFFVIGFI